uniref:Uncharacterized protein n=1 Tax=Arundo donax TaxID=35708 RepID=A0A0A9F068_ARUDO
MVSWWENLLPFCKACHHIVLSCLQFSRWAGILSFQEAHQNHHQVYTSYIFLSASKASNSFFPLISEYAYSKF